MHLRAVLLGEICDFRAGGAFPREVQGSDEGDYPFIKVSDMNLPLNGYHILEANNYVTEELREALGAKLHPSGATVFAKIGIALTSNRRRLLVRPTLIDNNMMSVIAREGSVDPAFLYYVLCTIDFNTVSTGTALPYLTVGTLQKIPVSLPPLLTQRKIAAILSAYDDMIENNLRRIRILEEMAQALYREWLIEFRFPGHERIRFVDSPLGKIPAGWEIKSLDFLIENHIGGGWGAESGDEKHTEPAWVIRGTDIPCARHADVGSVPRRFHTESNFRSRKLEEGDIVFEVSGGSKGQPVGRALLVTRELLAAFRGDSVICASFCKRVQPHAAQFGSELLYLSFLHGYTSGEIEAFQVQSTGISNFKWTEYLQSTNRCVPPNTLRTRFRDLVAPLFHCVGTLGLQASVLRRTRDLLLPRLISGDLDISNLDIAIPEAVA